MGYAQKNTYGNQINKLINNMCNDVTHPKLLGRLNCESKCEDNGRIKSWGMLFNSQQFGSRGACWNSRMGTRKSDKQINYSHKPNKPNNKLVSA
jgi:hypothetical protein